MKPEFKQNVAMEVTREQFKKHVLNMEFTKDDLKTGMVVEFDDGKRGLVLRDTTRGDIVAGCGITKDKTWFPLDCLNNDLTKDKTIIIKVYDVTPGNAYAGSLSNSGKLLWERKEEPDEYTITPEQAKSIIFNFACDDWKDKLFDLWGKEIVSGKDITVSYALYEQVKRAFTIEQNELFNKIFK